jgi:hypothetical protein
MTDIIELERELLRAHDLTDLADCIQLLRTLAWSTLGMEMARGVVHVWHEDIDAFAPAIAALDEIAGAAGEHAERAAMLSRLYARVRDALLAGPRRPTEREVVMRYVRGEIGDTTCRRCTARWPTNDHYALSHHKGITRSDVNVSST